jgi:hypothetical protein
MHLMAAGEKEDGHGEGGQQHEGAAHAFSLPAAALQALYLCSSLDESIT